MLAKIIFLDFDGVLNSFSFFERTGTSSEEINREFDALTDKDGPESFELRLKCLDPDAISRLNQIVEKTKAKIVLSTNWGLRIEAETLWGLLKGRGFKGEVLSKTPRKMSLYTREGEISMWLNRCEEDGVIEIVSFVILEDFHKMGDLEKRTIRTNPQFGLEDEHIEKAIEILNTPWTPEKT